MIDSPGERMVAEIKRPAVPTRADGSGPEAASNALEAGDLRSAVRRFTAEHISPIALGHDRSGESPLHVYRAFLEQGFVARFVPTDRETPGASLADACLVAEELAYGCAAISSLIMLPVFLNRVVLSLLDEPRRAAYRREVLEAPVVTSFAASELGAGSDLLGVETSAVAVDDGYLLDGRKEYSSNLRHAKYVIVVARTGSPDHRSSDVLTWFLVPTATQGVEIGERWETLGLRSLDVSPLLLRGVRVTAEHRLGAEGGGLPLMLETLGQSRTGIAAIAVGIARRARDEVLAYGKKRRLYGDKLIKLQDYRFRIAEMEVDIAAARALVDVAAGRYDAGLDYGKESSVAKLYAGQMVMRVTEAAAIMLGSVGYTGQSLVEKQFRDARHTAIVEGTEPVHKELIFASLLRRGGA